MGAKADAREAAKIWCDYCNVRLSHANIRTCVRSDCKTKVLVPRAERVFK